MTRRSSRAYSDRPVSTEDLEQIIAAGRYAPCAVGQQKWHFTVVRNRDILERIRVAVRDCFRKNLAFEEDPRHPKNPLAADMPDDYCCFYQAPCLVMVSMPRDNQNALTDGSCALENIFLAAHALGIDSCWINQQRSFCDEPELRSILDEIGVPADHIICGSAALGYATVRGKAAPRAEDTVTWVD